MPAPSSHSRGAYRRHTGSHETDLDEETTFALKNLSPASSIFQRKLSTSPTSFLWRVLEDGTILSVRAVDVCKQNKTPDASLVLNFKFTIPIQPSCVALTEPDDHDALFIYVIDQSNHLYSFSLRPDLFCRRSSLDSNIGDVCRVHLPPSLASRYPHRLVAAGANTLLVTLHDGGLVRLDRNHAHDGMYYSAVSIFPRDVEESPANRRTPHQLLRTPGSNQTIILKRGHKAFETSYPSAEAPQSNMGR